ncbi:MAG: NnrU family protein [Rhodobacteraceae bacterium CG17_big_fil_post_rev_8_21_14_2_50_63_15]|nr:MAG: NnrU family protein [Rhodobacteraceae bacterium CG17_big_fil_post_rev_8_21_14_2_50_63_15]
MGWIEFTVALGLFLISHRIPALIGVKAPLTAALGLRGYMVAFSLISTALLAWVIVAAGRAPYVGLWDHQIWHRWAVNIVMPMALALIVFGTAAPNPFAFEGRANGFDPARPGIAGLTRQPLLWGMALWSGAHLLANGDLAHGLLFGSFAVFSFLGMRIVEGRRARAMGAAEWQRLTARTSLIPFAALLTGRWKPATSPSLWHAALWLAVWAGLWLLHAPMIGVSPAP